MKFSLNDAPPLGYSFVYLEFYLCDNNKPFMVYPGITETAIDCRHGKRLSDSYYRTVNNYNAPIHRLTRMVDSEHIKTIIMGVVKTEWAPALEHAIIQAYKHVSPNVSNSVSDVLDLAGLSIPSVLYKVDPCSYKPVDVFEDVEDAAESCGFTVYDLNTAIEEKTELGRFLWIYSHDYDPPANEDKLYVGKDEMKRHDYTVKTMFRNWIHPDVDSSIAN